MEQGKISCHINGHSFNVINLTGNEGIDKAYNFTLVLNTQNNTRHFHLGSQVTLIFDTRMVSGILHRIIQCNATQLTLQIKPKLAHLNLQHSGWFFNDETYAHITDQLFQAHGFCFENIHYKLTQQYQAATCIQYSTETDLNFWQRITGHIGAYSWLHYDNDQENIIICDQHYHHPRYPQPLHVLPRSQLTTYQQPLPIVYAMSVIQQRSASNQIVKVYQVNSNIAYLYPGLVITLEANNDDKHLAGQYLIIDMQHKLTKACTYTNSLRLIPLAQAYRPTRQSTQPIINLSAKTRLNADSCLDQYGQYSYQYHFTQAANVAPIPRITPYLCPSTTKPIGLHFPLAKDIEVLIDFLNGDLQSPIITAALPDSQQSSSVNHSNSQQLCWLSTKHNNIIIDDRLNQSFIQIASGQYTSITMSNKATCQLFEISCAQGDILMHADQHMQLHAETKLQSTHQTCTWQCGSHNYTQATRGTIDIAAKQTITIASQRSQQIKSHDKLAITSQNLQCCANQDSVIKADNSYQLTVQAGNVFSQTQQLTLNTLAKGSLNLSAGDQSISLYPDGRIIMTANTLHVTTPSITCHGQLNPS